jgi:hypothetical protein
LDLGDIKLLLSLEVVGEVGLKILAILAAAFLTIGEDTFATGEVRTGSGCFVGDTLAIAAAIPDDVLDFGVASGEVAVPVVASVFTLTGCSLLGNEQLMHLFGRNLCGSNFKHAVDVGVDGDEDFLVSG